MSCVMRWVLLAAGVLVTGNGGALAQSGMPSSPDARAQDDTARSNADQLDPRANRLEVRRLPQAGDDVKSERAERNAEDRGLSLRLSTRIPNRIESRLRNRIDKDYDPSADIVTVFGKTDDEIRKRSSPGRITTRPQ